MPPSTFSTSLKTALYILFKTPSPLWSLGYLFQLLAEMCRYELWNHECVECTDFAGQEYHECFESTNLLVRSTTSALSAQTMLVESTTSAFKCTDYSAESALR